MPVYVQHEVLEKLPDVFNAEAIWQAPGLALFARRPLLRDLLERSPREHRGRAATRCFSHVTLMLPQEDVDDDRHLTRGARARDLAQTLAALHQKDFGDLLKGDAVRYDVVGAEALAPGRIEVKFGHAVYLPAADEKILYNVSSSRDSAIWKPVCPIYPDQRLTLIGASAEAASHAVPAWPFGEDGAILLVNDGPDAPLELQVRPKEALDCHYDPLHGYYTIKARRGGAETARLLMKIERVGGAARSAPAAPPAPARPPAVWQARGGSAPITVADSGREAGQPAVRARSPSASALSLRPAAARMPGAPDTDMSIVPQSVRPAAPESDATYAPTASRQRATLVALALPRLSRYRETGALALEIGLDKALAIARSEQDAAISFAVDATDTLYVCTSAGRQRIAAPSSFAPDDGRNIELRAPAPDMAGRYTALLLLPHTISAGVAPGARFVFGRSAPVLAALRVLDSPRFLRRGADSDGTSADRIGLSRNAFSFEAVAKGFKIGRLAASQALYHLDERLQFVASIGEASAEQPYLLPSGHHLVAGHYVLRLDA